MNANVCNERTRSYNRAISSVDIARLATEIVGVIFTLALIVLASWPRSVEMLPPIGNRIRIDGPRIGDHDQITLHIYNLELLANAKELDLRPTNVVVDSSHEPIVTAGSNGVWRLRFK